MEINTSWFNLTSHRKTLADEASKQGLTYATKLAGFEDVDLTVNDNEVVAIVSTDKIDAAGDIVVPKGMDLTRFRKTRQVYFEHNMDGLAIGAAQWIKSSDSAIIAKYFISQASEESRMLLAMVKEGVYRSHSIGFFSKDPSPATSQELRFHPQWKDASAIHRKGMMIEFSLVGQPCNDDAVALAVSKGFSRATIDLFTGRTQNSLQAASEVIAEVKKLEADRKSSITKKELSDLLAKRIEARYGKQQINADSVVGEVMSKLYASRH